MRFPWGTDSEPFIRDYWQRQPLFCPSALDHVPLPDWRTLSAHDDAEVRCIAGDDQHGYELVGFDTERPDALPFANCPWTVLVQDADLLDAQLAALREQFGFLPRWRLEDIMLSFAVDGGSVGPHSDAYDVFLVQAAGERRWLVAGDEDAASAAAEPASLRLVEPFEPALSVVAKPGDVLYLPPGVAHHGVAQGDCVTLSVGFRSPSLAELLAAVVEQLAGDQRYRDPDALFATACALGDAEAAVLQTRLRELITRERTARALACVATEVKPWLLPLAPDAPGGAGGLAVHPAARLMVLEPPHPAGVACNGEYFALASDDLEAVRLLAAGHVLDAGRREKLSASPLAREFIATLLTDGVLIPAAKTT